MFAFFTPGPMEIVLILFILAAAAVPIVLLVVILAVARKSGPATPDSPPCPNCGSHVVPRAKFCHQCGNALEEQQVR